MSVHPVNSSVFSLCHFRTKWFNLPYHAKYYSHTTQQQFGINTLHSNNLYQVFTYVKNKEHELMDTSHTVSGMLLYARTDESIIPDNEYHMSGNTISVKTLDLNTDFTSIAAQLNAIVESFFMLAA